MSLAPIPLKVAIVDSIGSITIFFLQRWEELRAAVGFVSAKAIVSFAGQTAALTSKLLYTVPTGGTFRVTFTSRRTLADGVASSLTFTWHWTDGGVPLSASAPVNNTDTTGSLYSETRSFPVDANTAITFDMAYTSSTPARMTYKLQVYAEQIAQQ